MTAASKHGFCLYATARMPLLFGEQRDLRSNAVIPKSASMDSRRYEVVAERILQQQRRHLPGVAKSYAYGRALSVGHAVGSTRQ